MPGPKTRGPVGKGQGSRVDTGWWDGDNREVGVAGVRACLGQQGQARSRPQAKALPVKGGRRKKEMGHF